MTSPTNKRILKPKNVFFQLQATRLAESFEDLYSYLAQSTGE